MQRQTIGNACGTIGLLHALGNAGVPLGKPAQCTHHRLTDYRSSSRRSFASSTSAFRHPADAYVGNTDRSSSTNANLSHQLNEASSWKRQRSSKLHMPQQHLLARAKRQTLTMILIVCARIFSYKQANRDPVHFAAFVESNGHLVELDGRNNSPVDRGSVKIDLLHVCGFPLSSSSC